MKEIRKVINGGPGELDIFNDIRRKSGGNHPQITFNGVKLPVQLTSLGLPEFAGDPDGTALTGLVLLNQHNRHRYHAFTAQFNVRTRKGYALFKTKCHDCGTEVDEFGLCPNCDPCPRCDRRECQPHFSCMILVCDAPDCTKKAAWIVKDGETFIHLCDGCYREHGTIDGTRLT